jgi:hypothetical protein
LKSFSIILFLLAFDAAKVEALVYSIEVLCILYSSLDKTLVIDLILSSSALEMTETSCGLAVSAFFLRSR